MTRPTNPTPADEAPSILHPALDPGDYENVGADLSNVRDWKARILVGNSLGKGQKRGHMTEVGYVLVPYEGPMLVVPVSRGDEHHRGGDMLHEMRRKRKWKVDTNVVPVFAQGHGLYLYGEDDIPLALEVIRRWRAAGGPNLMVSSGNSNKSWMMTFDDFVARKGQVKVLPNVLLPIGERFAKALEKVADGLSRCRDAANPLLLEATDRRGVRMVRDGVRDLMTLFEDVPSLCAIATDRLPLAQGKRFPEILPAVRGALDTALARDDLRAVERLVFWHDGLKNAVHMEIRADIAEDPYRSTALELFGDLRFADARLGRISPSPYDAPDGEDAPEPAEEEPARFRP